VKLAAISMIRDEADFIVTFLRHLAALFDIVFLLDQRSSDGSGEVMRQACASRTGWSYHYVDFSGRFQAEINTVFLEKAFQHGADATFLLDSDELVGVQTRAEVEGIAAKCGEQAALGILRWRNCVPQRFDTWRFDPSEALWISPVNTVWPKVVVPRSVFQRAAGVRVHPGGHNATASDGGKLDRVEVGHLFHVPVRSRQQFLQKVFLSVIANLAKHNPMRSEGSHKRRLLEIIAESDLTDVDLTSIAAQYPVKNYSPWSQSDELRRHGFLRQTLGIPLSDLPLREPPQPNFHKVVARALTEFQLESLKESERSLQLEHEVVRLS